MTRQRHANPLARAAFSLTEMLVVVFIIVMLMALLSPAIQRGKDSARRSRCASNIHQIWLGSMAYATNNRMVTMPTKQKLNSQDWDGDGMPDPGQKKLSFTDLVMPYLYPDFKEIDEDGDGSIDDSAYQGRDIFRCPNEKKLKKLGSWTKVQMDYGMNHFGRFNWMNAARPGWYWETMSQRSLSQVKNHTVVWIADADADNSPEDIGGISRKDPQGSEIWPLVYSFHKFAYVRHMGGHNVAQLDGGGFWYPGYEPLFEKWFIQRR